MGRESSARSRRTLPREGNRLSRRDGGPRTVRKTMPGLRGADRADCLRGQRDELLRVLPDRWAAPRRPRTVAPDARRLAAHARGNGRAPPPLSRQHGSRRRRCDVVLADLPHRNDRARVAARLAGENIREQAKKQKIGIGPAVGLLWAALDARVLKVLGERADEGHWRTTGTIPDFRFLHPERRAADLNVRIVQCRNRFARWFGLRFDHEPGILHPRLALGQLLSPVWRSKKQRVVGVAPILVGRRAMNMAPYVPLLIYG